MGTGSGRSNTTGSSLTFLGSNQASAILPATQQLYGHATRASTTPPEDTTRSWATVLETECRSRREQQPLHLQLWERRAKRDDPHRRRGKPDIGLHRRRQWICNERRRASFRGLHRQARHDRRVAECGDYLQWSTGAVTPQANDYSFGQLSGILADAQLSGTYSSALTLSNTANSYAGNGSALSGLQFGQLGGALASSQLSGAYGNQVALTNTANTFNGTFTGNGAGLTGIGAGLSWPVVQQTADYSVQLSDFSTPTTHGKFLVLNSTVSHTFTLPNPPPPTNGSCVAIGNAADAGINSGTNVFLTVNPNGVNMDTFTSSNSVTPTMPRHTAYLYCSDGTNYFRLGYAQNGVSEIGPWLKTVDTGTVNVMQSTFRNGMDFGLADGSMIFLQPKFANTQGIVTLNLNGLGAFKILKYGLQPLTPGDLQPTTYALLIYNQNNTYWELVNPQTAQVLGGTTASLGGSQLAAGACTSATIPITGVTSAMDVHATPSTFPGNGFWWQAYVPSPGTVTVNVCSAVGGTPVASNYNVRVTQ